MNYLKIVLAIFLLFFFLTGCSSQSGPVTNVDIVEATATAAKEVAAIDTATAPPPTATTAPTATIPPTATTKPTVTPEPVEELTVIQSNCVYCHSDKDLLMETTNPEEEKEPGESSGVG